MITLITGKKGSGKTKRLIELANKAMEASKGNVVFIEKGTQLTYDISHSIRLVDIESYDVCGFDALYGFISGICAGNYDVTDILVDSTLKIAGNDKEALTAFVEKVNTLSEQCNTNLVFSISADESELSDSVKKYL